MLNNKSIYLPAMSAGTQASALKKNALHLKNKKEYRFYGDNPLFKHEGMLVSAGHQYKQDILDEWGVPLKDFILLGDSGGYQIASGALDLTDDLKEKIFHWLENNTNYAINLDLPPYGAYSNRVKADFNENMRISVEHFEYFAKHKSGRVKYLNVQHGRGLSHVEKWYDKVKDFDFKGGWSIGSVFGNIYYSLLSFFFLLEKGEINKFENTDSLIHFLGFSKVNQLFVMLFLQECLNKYDINIRISYDSSSPFLLAAFGKYSLFLKKEGTSTMSFNNKIIQNNIAVNPTPLLPCSCPVCQDITFGEMFALKNKKDTGFNSEFYYILDWHNLYKFLEYKEYMERILLTECKEIWQTVFTTKDLKIMDLIDKCFTADSPTKFLIKNTYLFAELLDEPEILKKGFLPRNNKKGIL